MIKFNSGLTFPLLLVLLVLERVFVVNLISGCTGMFRVKFQELIGVSQRQSKLPLGIVGEGEILEHVNLCKTKVISF